MSEPRDQSSDATEDTYYMSISDMLVGLLFLFIIMLMYFALELRSTTETLVTAEQTRNELLKKVEIYLRDRGVEASADLSAGVLRLPDQILFEKGRALPKESGVTALHVLADALSNNLPCYAFQLQPPPSEVCSIRSHHLEAILIEGHTDSDPVTPTVRIADNWDLSAARAANTFRILTTYDAQLLSFLSADPAASNARPIFSVAGYADQRPVDEGTDEAAKNRNRRIDLRFVMAGPDL